MFGSDLLEVVIGIAFIYILVSVICSAVREVVSLTAAEEREGPPRSALQGRAFCIRAGENVRVHALVSYRFPDFRVQ